jgi:hypothetical protein
MLKLHLLRATLHRLHTRSLSALMSPPPPPPPHHHHHHLHHHHHQHYHLYRHRCQTRSIQSLSFHRNRISNCLHFRSFKMIDRHRCPHRSHRLHPCTRVRSCRNHHIVLPYSARPSGSIIKVTARSMFSRPNLCHLDFRPTCCCQCWRQTTLSIERTVRVPTQK